MGMEARLGLRASGRQSVAEPHDQLPCPPDQIDRRGGNHEPELPRHGSLLRVDDLSAARRARTIDDGGVLDEAVTRVTPGHGQPIRTRIFIGVDPKSKASRSDRSTYRRYVWGNRAEQKRVNVGGSMSPWTA